MSKSDYITTGFLIALFIVAVILFIAQLTIPTKRQAFKVYKENELTIVEKVED